MLLKQQVSCRSRQTWEKSTALTALMRASFAEFNADIQLNTQLQLQKKLRTWVPLSILSHDIKNSLVI